MASGGRKRVKRSWNVDADQADWVAAKSHAASTSESTIVRQILRAAMNVEYLATTTDIDTEQGG